MALDVSALFAELDAPIEGATEKISAEDFSSLLAGLDLPASKIYAERGEGEDGTERKRRSRARAKKRSVEDIAILDMETDPFDNEAKSAIFPFLAVLYSDNFEPIVIWDEDQDAFATKVIAAIEALPRSYTIYAHNGGKFDYMFLVKKLRGDVSFKGRGIMRASIGNHEIRDSFHIIPDRLANFKKDHIDYSNMRKGKRDAYRKAIIDYCISDCRYLLEIVKEFATRFGLKLSIGQAAMFELRKHYKFERVSETTDAYLRQWFFGGRVECLAGRGHFRGAYKLYDVNSMYPFVMATYAHPIGSNYVTRAGGEINEHTFFIDLTCHSAGAFVRKGDEGQTYAPHGRFRFKTTVHEYKTAIKHKLIRDIEIHSVVDCYEVTKFDKFIVPIYDERQIVKERLKAFQRELMEHTNAYNDAIKDDMFLKYLLNNSWGKFAQNPRRYKEYYLTDPGDRPPDEAGEFGLFPATMLDEYWIWERPAPSDKFNNVGTGASVTGAARATLLDAMCNAKHPIYCDTDSLICTDLSNVILHPTQLGAWDIEKNISEAIINGKKLYAYRDGGGKEKVKSKGTNDMQWADMVSLLNNGEVIKTAFGPTLTKNGNQNYMSRRIRATTPSYMDDPHGEQSFWRCPESWEQTIPSD